jgi:hypothetical protein
MTVEEGVNAGASSVDENALFSHDAIIPEDGMTQESVTAEIMGKTKGDGASPDNNGGGTPGGSPTEPDNTKKGFETLSPEWRMLAEDLHTEENPYTPPAEILSGKKADGTELTEKERWSMLVKEIKEKTTPNPMFSDDPTMLRYRINRLKEDFDPVTFFEEERRTHEILRLPAKEYMTEALKASNKYTEEQITDYVSKLNEVELEEKVKGMKTAYINAINERDQQERNAILGQFNNQNADVFKKEEAQNQEEIKRFIEKNTNNRKFHGIELSEADSAQFYKELPELIKRDPETRISKFDAYLQSNEAYLNLLPLVWAAMNGKLPAVISEMKESLKAEIEKKAGITGNIHQGGSNDDGVNSNALYGR